MSQILFRIEKGGKKGKLKTENKNKVKLISALDRLMDLSLNSAN